jgi:GAF domain
VTLSRKGAKSRTHGRKLRSTGTKARTRADRMRNPPADLEQQLESCRHELTEAQNHLAEALEQQTATAEVFKIISASPTDLQPVLDAVVRSAARFCQADDVTIFELDGDDLRAVAHWGAVPQDIGVPFPCVRGHVSGRTVLDRRPVHVTDLQSEAEEFPEGSAFAKRLGHRTTAGVPLLREGVAVGTIQLRRAEVNLFTDKQIALLETFANQAVIAIENTRLLNELRQRTDDLTESLQQQTATSEVLSVISKSPGNLELVFQAMLEHATRICEATKRPPTPSNFSGHLDFTGRRRCFGPPQTRQNLRFCSHWRKDYPPIHIAIIAVFASNAVNLRIAHRFPVAAARILCVDCGPMEQVAEIRPDMAHVDIAIEPTWRRKRPKKPPRYAFDRRKRLGRRAKELVAIFRERIGPDVADDPVMSTAIRRCAETVALSEDLRARMLRGEAVSPDDVLRTTRAADALTRRLHLDRHNVAQRPPTLSEYLAVRDEG